MKFISLKRNELAGIKYTKQIGVWGKKLKTMKRGVLLLGKYRYNYGSGKYEPRYKKEHMANLEKQYNYESNIRLLENNIVGSEMNVASAIPHVARSEKLRKHSGKRMPRGL